MIAQTFVLGEGGGEDYTKEGGISFSGNSFFVQLGEETQLVYSPLQ